MRIFGLLFLSAERNSFLFCMRRVPRVPWLIDARAVKLAWGKHLSEKRSHGYLMVRVEMFLLLHKNGNCTNCSPCFFFCSCMPDWVWLNCWPLVEVKLLANGGDTEWPSEFFAVNYVVAFFMASVTISICSVDKKHIRHRISNSMCTYYMFKQI